VEKGNANTLMEQWVSSFTLPSKSKFLVDERG